MRLEMKESWMIFHREGTPDDTQMENNLNIVEQRRATKGNQRNNIRDIRSESLEFIRVYEISFYFFTHCD